MLTIPSTPPNITYAVRISSRGDQDDGKGTKHPGEVGLSGEIRGVSQVDVRLKEAEKLGFKRFILPRINSDNLNHKDSKQKYIGIENINEAIEILFD